MTVHRGAVGSKVALEKPVVGEQEVVSARRLEKRGRTGRCGVTRSSGRGGVEARPRQ